MKPNLAGGGCNPDHRRILDGSACPGFTARSYGRRASRELAPAQEQIRVQLRAVWLCIAVLSIIGTGCRANWHALGCVGTSGVAQQMCLNRAQAQYQRDQEIQRANEEHARQVQAQQQQLQAERENAAALARSEAPLSTGGQSVEPSAAASSGAAGRLLVFGGRDHKVFLGCFCDPTDVDSVFNRSGSHGQFSTDSLWNRFSEYSSTFSSYSVCNPYASDPPVVVDSRGAFYGRLTINMFGDKAIADERVITYLRDVVCR